MSTWLEVVDSETGERLAFIDDDDTCQPMAGHCGSCGDCQAMQAHYAGHQVRAIFYGPSPSKDFENDRGRYEFVKETTIAEAILFCEGHRDHDHRVRRVGHDKLYRVFRFTPWHPVRCLFPDQERET